jgi:hypothetical protein
MILILYGFKCMEACLTLNLIAIIILQHGMIVLDFSIIIIGIAVETNIADVCPIGAMRIN